MTLIDTSKTTFSLYLDNYITSQRAIRTSFMVRRLGRHAMDNPAYYDYLSGEINTVSNIIDRCEAAALAIRNPVSV